MALLAVTKLTVHLQNGNPGLVQRATVEVLNTIYETDFLGFSYGFRPGRSQHNALDALYAGLLTREVNWVIEVDIRGFFDSIDHGWLVRFIEHRIADWRVVRLIQKWLNAGVLEDGKRTVVEEGTPQGGSASPLLANVYLHYVFDLWVRAWRSKQARGDMIVVRFADGHRAGIPVPVGGRALLEGTGRTVSEVPTGVAARKDPPPGVRPVRGRKPEAARSREARDVQLPRLHAHLRGKKRSNGRFTVLRRTIGKRLQAKLSEVKAELRRRMHDSIPEVGKWLRSVVEGHIRYYGVPMNIRALSQFQFVVGRHWHRALSRRSQNGRVLWDRMRRLINRWLPLPRVCHPYPLRRLGVIT